MKEGNCRGFYRLSKAWYAKNQPNKRQEISFGLYCESGGCKAEIIVEWVELKNDTFPKLNICDDAWKLLPEFKDLFQELGEVSDDKISEEDFAEILLRYGFKDLTAYKTPEKYLPKPKIIQFIDTNYKSLFSIDDGDEIEWRINDLNLYERKRCVYIDEHHFRIIGGKTYHIYQFALEREKYGIVIKKIEK